MELEKLFNNIHNQLKSESNKYKRLKICKYSFELSKVIVLSLATGLSFISIFSILSLILIPIIDVTKHNSQMLIIDYLIQNLKKIYLKNYIIIEIKLIKNYHKKKLLIYMINL